MDRLKLNFKEKPTSTGLVGQNIYDIGGESKIRFVVNNADVANALVIKAKVHYQKEWSILTTFTGSGTFVVNVATYDELQIELTSYNPSGNLEIICSSFDGASGSAIESIDVTAGDTITDASALTFSSLDGSVIITGNNVTKSIDFSVNPDIAPVTSVNGEVGDVVLDKSSIGLSNVDNTSDADKPISDATQTALDGKEPSITSGTVSQYYRGDKTFQTLDKSAVGLSNVDNTSDLNKPISTAVQAAFDANTYYHELHVNYDYVGGGSDGSPYKPFTTTQAAINAAQLQNVGGNTAILIHLKKDIIINESLVINNAVSNLYLTTAIPNNIDASPLKFIGSLTISGTQTNRVRVKDLNFSPTSGYALIIDGTNGRHMFQNCQFSNGGNIGLAGTGVTLINTYKNFIEFVDCSVEGVFNIDGTPSANTLVSLYRCRLAYANVIVNSPNVIVSMYDNYSINGLTHTNGALAITGSWGITSFFNSTANLSATNILSMSNVSFQKPDFSFVAINKTGTCFYQLMNVHRGETSDVLNGSRIVYGPTATDAGYKMGVSGNWSPAVSNVAGALDQLAANKISTSQKGAANGVAPLNASTKIDAIYLPSYVDDIVEVANYSALPVAGETGKIYVTLDDNKLYRWSGSVYVEVSQGITDHTLLSNIGTNSHADIDAALNSIINVNWTGDYNNGTTYTVGDGVMFNGASFRMIAAIGAAGYAPPAYPANWLQVTDYVSPNDIGLGNVDNTSDLDKPISNDTQDALDLKVDKAGDTMTGSLNMSALSENIQFSVYGLNATQGIEIKSDDDATRPTGNVTISTGDASNSDAAGSIYLQGGSNVDGNPGNILLTAGQSSGIGSDGVIVLDAKGVVYLNDNASGSIDAGSHRIQNVDDPTADQDAATRKWVDQMSAIDNVLFVSPSANSIIADGSLNRPYATIAAALAIAIDNNVLVLLPGTYGEPTVVIPSSLSSLVMQGTAASSTVITNGISYTPSASSIDLLIQKVNIGTLTLDASAALNGLVTLKQVITGYDRQDTNNNVFCITTESTCFGGTIAGGGNNFSECLMISSIDLNGGLSIFENTKFVSHMEAYGTAIVRLLDCELFGATEFVNGNTVLANDPVIEMDASSDALGTLTGNYTKTLLANIPLANLTQSGATSGQVPSWNGTEWVPTTVSVSSTWGSITGTLADQTDLQSALDGKVEKTGDTMTGTLDFDFSVGPITSTITIADDNIIIAYQDPSGPSDFTTDILGGNVSTINNTTGANTSVDPGSIFLYDDGMGTTHIPTVDAEVTTKKYVDDQDALKEDVANKSTDGTLASNSNTLYPSEQAVKTYVDNLSFNVNQVYLDTKEPTGFVNRNHSTISFDDASRTFTIQPTAGSFDVYIRGTKYIKTVAENTVISTTNGNHYIYYNASGVLTSTTTFTSDLIEQYAIVAIVYWNSDTGLHTYFAEERHGITMDGATHSYLHTIFGARYLTGLALQGFTVNGAGNLDAEAQFTADGGNIRDEDILHELPPQTQIPIYYRQGQLWRRKASDSYPLIYSGTAGYTGASGRIPYNEYVAGTWQLTQVANNGFVLVHFFATNDVDDHIIGVQGTNTYGNVTAARVAAASEISSLSGLPFAEFVALGSVVFESSNSFTNTPKCIVRSVNGGDYVDFRGTQLYTPAGTATTHGLLSGLSNDDHPQYHTDARGDARYDLKAAGDISETSFSLINNQSSASNITGFVFSSAVVRSFEAEVSVAVDAGSDYYETFKLYGVNKGGNFDYYMSSFGDDSGVTLSVTSAGQVQYTSNSYVGFVNAVVKFKAKTLNF